MIDIEEVKKNIVGSNGRAVITLHLPTSIRELWQSGKVWDAPSESKYWGTLLVFPNGYDDEGVLFFHWGRQNKMTWKFVQTYAGRIEGRE